jgi:hypothetical protein
VLLGVKGTRSRLWQRGLAIDVKRCAPTYHATRADWKRIMFSHQSAVHLLLWAQPYSDGSALHC